MKDLKSLVEVSENSVQVYSAKTGSCKVYRIQSTVYRVKSIV